MPQDSFAHTTDSLIAPARLAFAITPNNALDLNEVTKAIYVGTGGDIVLRAIDSDADVILRNVVSGSVIAIRTVAVRATGTTAADMVGLA